MDLSNHPLFWNQRLKSISRLPCKVHPVNDPQMYRGRNGGASASRPCQTISVRVAKDCPDLADKMTRNQGNSDWAVTSLSTTELGWLRVDRTTREGYLFSKAFHWSMYNSVGVSFEVAAEAQAATISSVASEDAIMVCLTLATANACWSHLRWALIRFSVYQSKHGTAIVWLAVIIARVTAIGSRKNAVE